MELQILQLLGLFPGSVSGISSMQYLNQASPTPISGDITDEVESVNVDPCCNCMETGLSGLG